MAKSRFAHQSLVQDKEIGYHLKTYAGWSTDETKRINSASGGVIMTILRYLLNSGEVDSVFCVGLGEAKDRLFEFIEITNADQLEKCASSKYYPVDMEKVIFELQKKKSKRNIAITGLPCSLKGLSLAMKKFPRIRNQVRYMIGLVCRLLPNRYYTEFLSELSLGKKKEVIDANFRSKKNTKISSNFNFIAVSSEAEGDPLAFNSIVNIPYTNGMFQHNACNFCDDVFAEVADISLMDAWIPEYVGETKGTSLMVVRSKGIEEILVKLASNGEVELRDSTPAQIKRSQQGVILKKQKKLAGRLNWAHRKGLYVPAKRIKPKEKLTWTEKLEIVTKKNLQDTSKELWKSGVDAKSLLAHPKIRFFLFVLKLFNFKVRLNNLISEPQKLSRFVFRKFKFR